MWRRLWWMVMMEGVDGYRRMSCRMRKTVIQDNEAGNSIHHALQSIVIRGTIPLHPPPPPYVPPPTNPSASNTTKSTRLPSSEQFQYTPLIPANTSSSVHCRSGEGGAQCASNKLVKFSNKKTKNATTMKTNKQNATSD